VRRSVRYAIVASLAICFAPARVDAARPRAAGNAPGADLLREVRDRAKAGERREALGIIDTFLAESPTSPLTPSALLLAASLDASAERAAERWSRILSTYGDAPEAESAALCLMRYEFSMGFFPRVVEDAQDLLAKRRTGEPAASEAGYWSLLARIARGDDPAKLGGALERIEASPWPGRASVALGEAYLARGLPERALELAARESDNRDDDGVAAAALYLEARALWAVGDSSGAARALERVVRRFPDSIEAAKAAEALEASDASARIPDATEAGSRYAVVLGEFETLTEAERFVGEFSARRSERPRISPVQEGDRPKAAGESGASTERENGAARYQVSVGEFATPAHARDLVSDLAEEGFDARVGPR